MCLVEYRNIGVPGASGSGSNQDAQQAAAALAQMARASGPSLAEVLKPEVILPLLQVDRSYGRILTHTIMSVHHVKIFSGGVPQRSLVVFIPF